MHYYEVFVAEVSYQKTEPLTYSYDLELPEGTLVLVPYGRKTVAGFIDKPAGKPSFATKPIAQILSDTPLPSKVRAFHKWMMEYYPGGSGATTQLFVPSGLQVKSRKTDDNIQAEIKALPVLTKQQQSVVEEINNSDKRTFLLHGETGSGKTRIYVERARAAIEKNASVLILSPEISLVPQLAQVFAAQFQDRVVIMHSGLTKATRNRNFLKILQAKEPLIIIGTRSALFSPINNLGLIAVDEMHEPAYKQEQAPRYYALRAAGALAKLHNSEIIYGSATPPVTEHYIAETTHLPILRMTETAQNPGVVKRTIIDIKDKKLFSRHPYISDSLLSALEHNLHHHNQSLLFLNRRGTARLILCQNCGWQAMCPRCDTPLTYHGDNHTMRCHTCGYRGSPPYACPICGSDDISYRSVGTKALVDSLHSLLPHALIKRFDTDNYADETLARHFEDVQKGKIDILVGTQMLGKGLDLPKLSLVGIINADAGLHMPDFSAAERNYQLLHQAIGRVGRGHTDGEVIIQTLNPDQPMLIAATQQNWSAMYTRELEERQQYGFPPFRFLLKIDITRKTARSSETFATKLHDTIAKMHLPIELHDPAPAFYEKSHGLYHWQLIIRSKNRTVLTSLVNKLPPGNYTYDLDPINLL